MKIVISPAKSLDFESEAPFTEYSQPIFLKQAERLNRILRKKSARSLSKLMSISPALGQLNYERNQEWELPFEPDNSKQAVYAFTGEVYRGLDANTIPEEDLEFLQNSLRILSGQYGILKPLDLIQAYRLEMGTKLKVGVKPNLYKFWGSHITDALNNELDENELFVNLASNEYFKAIQPKDLKVPVITPVFKDLKNGEYKVIMTFAKHARGLMVRYLVDHKISNIEGIKGFNYGGYGFDENLSTETQLVFTR
ncbi:peroxide stress protein YaaA [Lutimonas saemankumensis]|uniref:peroxide stress protein YaaA n=1 Tax=Lutimonas saemankumensis TaxID=483016 RepID=UPI001CD51755|nr:peroxide stress protein YaaA [Lutimonas saemankumensis]MCA0932246.1 peroxide stress protein YaaA [Lutimonas saemankumensis]